jgi:outer membrane protein
MKTIKLSLLVVALLAAAGAQAQKAGDTIVGFGIAFVRPDASLGPASASGSSTTIPAGPYTGYTSAQVFTGALTGATANIDNTSTPTISVLHMFTNDIGAELSLGVPPKLTINMAAPHNTAEPVVNAAATAKALTPALVAKYFFMEPNGAFRPYVGLGITHASFSNVTPRTSSTTVAELAGISATMSSSWAPVYNAGLVYNINDKWSINGSVSYIPLKSDVVFVGPGFGNGLGNVTTNTKLTLNPTDYVIRLGYKF